MNLINVSANVAIGFSLSLIVLLMIYALFFRGNKGNKKGART